MTVPQLGRPAGSTGEETRKRIIAATMRCVAEVGYARATIREIAHAAGITSGTLYHYFPNKSELLRGTITAIEAAAQPRLRAAAQTGGSAPERLDAVLDEFDRLIREYPQLAGFERAVRAATSADPGAAMPQQRLALLEHVIGEILDATQPATLPAGERQGAIDVLCALSRALAERAENLSPEDHRATLKSAKQLIRGALL